MKVLFLGFIFLLFISCGEENANQTDTTEQNGPTSPVIENKEEVPPSIPNI
ncbi:MAG: Unknown protein [uncultured Sulfurovum sp.]|uniref:Cytochrome C n=1 Tax=uncultured Sulfurovum sp. TaxID=269237 RepID=A0A6S6S826_9BACT|nr:MAG: Unknown protein [uncultured Sulfurovum sp.]